MLFYDYEMPISEAPLAQILSRTKECIAFQSWKVIYPKCIPQFVTNSIWHFQNIHLILQ